MDKVIVVILSAIKDFIIPITTFIRHHFVAICSIITFFGLAVFLLPIQVFEFFAIDGLRVDNLEKIGVATYLSIVCVVVGLLYRPYKQHTDKKTESKDEADRITIIDNLTRIQQGYLRNYTQNQSKTHQFNNHDGVVQSLIEKGILYKPNSRAYSGGEQDYNIHDWYYEYLSSGKKAN